MRLPFKSMFITSPFEGLQEHAEKVKECTLTFQEAIECHCALRCRRFLELKQEIGEIESDADAIKRRIRGHLPKGTLMPVEKFQLFRYLREQDSVLDAVEETLNWISYRDEPAIPEELQKDFFIFIDATLEPIELLSKIVKEARDYFKNYSEDQRNSVKELIHNLRLIENEADKYEDDLKRKIFNLDIDPVTIFHMVGLAEKIGRIADHAENAGDMMRAMISK
ncbi:MAG: TIGR00153 family protein [Desulfobacterales bacterium]|nr:TIGR00153 family protein [Desulfobacterales bacterium]